MPATKDDSNANFDYTDFFYYLTEQKGLSELTAQLYAGHISGGNKLSGASHKAANKHYALYKGMQESKNEYREADNKLLMVLRNRKGEETLVPVKPGDLPLLVDYRWYPSINSRGYLTVCAKISGKTVTLAQHLQVSGGSGDEHPSDEPYPRKPSCLRPSSPK